MPAPLTANEFLELVRKSGLLDDRKLKAYLETFRATPPMPERPEKVAGPLVAQGLLTGFQAEQLLQGKWRRFTIGKYQVLERLGSGGQGTVYLCRHLRAGRRVALKVLPVSSAADPAALERFYREARALAALDHPNIVRAYDIDQDSGLHFLVLEHVDGATLREMVQRSGPLDPLRAAHYIRQAALGLQHAFQRGVVHRAIKPGNILVDRTGTVKVVDMGRAHFLHDEEDVFARKSGEQVAGTAGDTAPEQALDSPAVEVRADVYQLGATFYFCLTGRTPFRGGTVTPEHSPEPIRSLRPEAPEGLVTVVDRMLDRDAGRRYPTPLAVAEALGPWTQTPILPPPESEMPWLSPAARDPEG